MVALNSYTPVNLLSAVAEETLADTRLTETPLLGALAPSARLQRQRDIEWGARVADAVSGGRALDGALADDTSGSLAQAKLTIPDYYFKYQFSVFKRNLVEAASIGKIEAVRDAVGSEVEDALRALTQTINGVLYTGAGTVNDTSYGVLGLASIDNQTGSYAGISRSTYPRWRSIIQQGGTPGTPENLTVDRVTALLRARRNAGATAARNNGRNLIILTSDEIEQDVLRKLYQSEAQVQADYANLVANIAPYAGYAVQGIPVISDVVSAVDNKMFFIDPSKMGLYVFDDSGAVAQNKSDRIDYFSYEGLRFRMADVSDEHPDKLSFEITISMQLKCHDPIQGLSVMEDVDHTIA